MFSFLDDNFLGHVVGVECYDFKEIFKLKGMLDAYNLAHGEDKIHYTFKDGVNVLPGERNTGYHIWCYDDASCTLDTLYISIIQSSFSYGRDEDLLEIMGLLTEEELEKDSVAGWLSADNVFERILKYKKGGV